MQVLWDLQSATVADVVSRLKSNYSTVQTMLRILERKGYVAHEKAGRAFAYRPLIDQKQARRSALSHLVSGLFDNSPSLLVLNVLEDERIESGRARPAPPVNHGERIVESALPALVNWLWQGSAIALAATAILRPSRRISATTRYQLWWIALFIVLALPILSFQLPAASFQQEPAPSHVRELGAAAGSVPGSTNLEAGSWKLEASPSWTGALLAFLWLSTAAVSLSRTAVALIALRRVKRTARPFPEACEARLHTWLLLRSLGRPARLVVSDHIHAAAVLGLTSPSIAVAPPALEALDDLELDQIVVHEWAHVQRRDDLARLAQRIIVAFAGLHPAVWWIDRQLHLERETACDDWAVQATGSAKSLAVCLTKLAALPGPTVTFGAGPGGARVFAADSASRPAARSTPQHVDHADVRSADARRARPGCAGADRCERGARGDVTCYPGCPGRRDVGADERRLIGRRYSDRAVSARAADRSKRIASTRAAKSSGFDANCCQRCCAGQAVALAGGCSECHPRGASERPAGPGHRFSRGWRGSGESRGIAGYAGFKRDRARADRCGRPGGIVEKCHSLGRGRPGRGNGRESFAAGRSSYGGILYES